MLVMKILNAFFRTSSPSPARVHVVFADAASEEALAAVAAGRPVVLASGSVSTYGTQAARPQVARGVHVGALGRRGV